MDHFTAINFTLCESNKEEIALLANALSSTTRLDILELININSGISIVQLAKKLDIAVSSAAFHVDLLNRARLIETASAPGKHGTLRICYPLTNKITVELLARHTQNQYNIFSYNIPIGSYNDCFATPTCGLASETEILEQADSPSSFFSPRKVEAQIIWMHHGQLTYKIPNYFLEANDPQEISFSLELCSEAPFYNLNYPSDITVWINGIETSTYTCPSDYGDRPGKLTPKWWSPKLTQYGELIKFSTDKKGSYINNILVSYSPTIDDLKLKETSYISFKIGIKDDAVNKGGINIFGEKFGDYEQNIIMKLKCL